MALRRIVAAACTVVVAGCSRPPVPPSVGEWSYDVTFPDDLSQGYVAVEATFVNAGTTAFRIRPELAPIVSEFRVDRGAVSARAEGWTLSECFRRCTVSYRLDVRRVVGACDDDLGCAVGVDGAVLAPITTWLVRPSPKRDVPAHVRLHGTYESGLGRGKTRGLRSLDLDEGSFVAFGATRRLLVGDTTPIVEVGRMPVRHEQVHVALGRALASFPPLGPIAPTVFVFNTHGEARGKVMALSGASVALDSGEEGDLARERVALHELAHLTVPTVRGEGRWVGEGFAVYFEALMRAEQGSLSRDALLEHLRTLATSAPQRAPLVTAQDDDSMYAGGALFALVLDLELRAQCRSLPSAVRDAMAKGANATGVMRLRDYFALLSVVTQSDVPLDVFQRVALGGGHIDVPALIARLSRQPWLVSPMIPAQKQGAGAKHCADVP